MGELSQTGEIQLEIVFAPHVRCRQIMESLKDVAVSVVFECTPAQVRLWGTTATARSRCDTDLKFHATACRRYALPSQSQPYVFGVRVQPLMSLLRGCKKKDNTAVAFRVVSDTASAKTCSLEVSFVSDDAAANAQTGTSLGIAMADNDNTNDAGTASLIPLLSAEEMKLLYPLPQMPPLSRLHKFMLPAQEFKRICLELTVIGNAARISLTPHDDDNNGRRSVLIESADSRDAYARYELTENPSVLPGSTPVVVSPGEDGDDAAGVFALRYLNFFAKPAQLKTVYAQAQQVCLGIGTGQPLVVRYLLENIGDITFYLQPVSDDQVSYAVHQSGIDSVFS